MAGMVFLNWFFKGVFWPHFIPRAKCPGKQNLRAPMQVVTVMKACL